jgi:hypothetical protein
MSSNRILVVIPGFGQPHVENKLKVLKGNLNLICQTNASLGQTNASLDLILFHYSIDDNLNVSDHLEDQKERFGKITIINEKGILGQFIYKYLKQELIENYDYVFMILDDIVLQPNFNLDQMIQIYQEHQFSLLSPSLTPGSRTCHRDMISLKNNKGGRVVTVVEFFCYLMSGKKFIEYQALFTTDTVWCWGLPRVLHPIGWKNGILDCMTMHHLYAGGSRGGAGEYQRLGKRYKMSNFHNISTFQVPEYVSVKPEPESMKIDHESNPT